jgi:sugar phosphate isomerase/epimerase
MYAGVTNEDLIEIIKRYPGRSTTVHLKEYSSSNDKALVGEGDVNFKEFIKTCEEFGKTEWYIIEQESYAYEPLECVRISIENLKKILKEM